MGGIAAVNEVNEIFNFGEFSVRTLKIGENVYFNAQDVAAALGFVKTRNAVQTYVADRHKIFHKRPVPGRSPIYITEGAMYKFALQCRMPNAEKFCDWVTDEVLVKIRKTGRYEFHDLENFKAIAERVDKSTPDFKEIKKICVDTNEKLKDDKKVTSGRNGGRACQQNIRKMRKDNKQMKLDLTMFRVRDELVERCKDEIEKRKDF